MLVNTYFENKVEQLFEVAGRLAQALSQAGIEYRVIGGFAAYMHVNEIEPMAARLTRDIDVAIDRKDLEAIAEATRPFGFRYRHAAGVDMLVDAEEPKAHSAVHLVFTGEKVRKEYTEPVPTFSPPARYANGISIISVADLVKMKLTSFRLKDRVHIQDLDAVGLITPDIEAQLAPALKARLREVRATE
jgi:hypothetical protein